MGVISFGFCALLTVPHYSLNISFLSDAAMCSRFILYFFFPRLVEISLLSFCFSSLFLCCYFYKESWFLSVKNIRNQGLGARYTHTHTVCMCIYIYTCIYIYSYLPTCLLKPCINTNTCKFEHHRIPSSCLLFHISPSLHLQ